MTQAPSALIIDDAGDIRELARERLKARGFHPIWAVADGESAIAIVHEHEPDLVVLDFKMPDMDGEAVARALKLLAPNARILLFSAIVREKPAWADAYLDKAEQEAIESVATDLLGPPGRRSGSAPADSIPTSGVGSDLFAGMVENVPIPIFLKDPEGVYLVINSAFVELNGISRERIIGRKDTDIYPASTAAAFRSEDLLAMNSLTPVQSTRPVEVADDARMFRTVKVAINNSKGEMVGICGVSLDVTDTLIGQRAREAEEKRISAAKPFERLLASFTPQESRVAGLLLEGLSDKEIAETMSLSVDTVRHHVSNVLRKLRRRSRTQVVIEMLRHRSRD